MNLVSEARKALKKGYAPYSRFKVGCALLTSSGKIYTGVNVENASYGACICAERVAIGTAVAAGETKIRKIAVVASRGAVVAPCGICRQVISEFADSKTEVICSNPSGSVVKKYKIGKLLPDSFNRKSLE